MSEDNRYKEESLNVLMQGFDAGNSNNPYTDAARSVALLRSLFFAP